MKEILATVYTEDGDKVTVRKMKNVYDASELVDSAFELGCMVVMEKPEPEEEEDEEEAQA